MYGGSFSSSGSSSLSFVVVVVADSSFDPSFSSSSCVVVDAVDVVDVVEVVVVDVVVGAVYWISSSSITFFFGWNDERSNKLVSNKSTQSSSYIKSDPTIIS
ncbi:hypothetical protein SAMD00019534_016250 [Acytostelium subglobosum LB1]|uniref:hypothetical protein n=1 Tax=Acytostelium subglobosum LB1 TaxID=1410327 RepID=UPI0006449654|nr:hypothetical protein SAMD00019534_016250 [Acytostelium subglobosum LB1]GAM18450.1 hypothetical protein SAMD00019534_016250 [Acytostelium subglobosum LB1]|eukprot:XP_012757670.1 hypothetical protein SAMD00019534_016250 [Acytostelium subglobosum LB1]